MPDLHGKTGIRAYQAEAGTGQAGEFVLSTHFPFGSNESPQIDLDFSPRLPLTPAKFDGETYEPKKDQRRLSGQLFAVRTLMADKKWRTLAEISATVGGSEAGVSARLRDLRKPRFGSYTVNRRRKEGGLWEYQVA